MGNKRITRIKPEAVTQFKLLGEPSKQIIISKYIQKGGVSKTTTSFNEARTCALSGLKTLIIGLDFECSITDVILPKAEILSLDNNQKSLGLYQFFAEKADIGSIITKTSLPTLDIIPETHDLVALDKWLNQQKRREYIFRDYLVPLLKEYQVIIFDNGPSWNLLIENSLTASNVVISPLGCNLLAYNAAQTNFSSIYDFQEIMGLDQKIIMFPTMLERTALSRQIYDQYIQRFGDHTIPIAIKSSVKWQESLVFKQTIFEYAPNSPSAKEYCKLIAAIWAKIVEEPKYKQASASRSIFVEGV